jgi:cyanophycinase
MIPTGNAARACGAKGFLIFTLLLFALTLCQVTALGETDSPKGHLVIIGGGTTVASIRQRALQLSGGINARVLVIPHASGLADAGKSSVKMWQGEGVKSVSILDTKEPLSAVAAVRTADLIWFPGGDQKLLMAELKKLGVVEAIRERHRAGATIGGTSAGAAVMSTVMIAGNRSAVGKSEEQAPLVADGLGLWPEAIVDQHFLKRSRQPRLRATVLQHPRLLGVGIDEATAVVVTGREFEVIGTSKVVVMDARKSASNSVQNIVETTLSAGAKFSLDSGVR